jgi:hypothetical protein
MSGVLRLREQRQSRRLRLLGYRRLARQDVDPATKPGADARVSGLALEGVEQLGTEVRAVLFNVILEAPHGIFPLSKSALLAVIFRVVFSFLKYDLERG